MRALYATALLLVTFTTATADESEAKQMLQVDMQDIALFKFVKEVKAKAKELQDPLSNMTTVSLSTFIREALLPKGRESMEFMRDKLKWSEHAVIACHGVVTGSMPDQKAAAEDVEGNNDKQKQCEIKDYEDMTAEEQICADFAANAMAFQKHATKLQKVKHNLRTFEKSLKDYYDYYTEFLREKKACWDATGEEHSQHAHCLFRKHYIQKAYCALRHNVTALCNEYDKCYAEAKIGHEEFTAKVKALEPHTIKVYRTLECMIKNPTNLEFAFSLSHTPKDINERAFLDCNTDTVGTDGAYDLVWFDYPPVPAKGECPMPEAAADEQNAKPSGVVCAEDKIKEIVEAQTVETSTEPSAESLGY